MTERNKPVTPARPPRRIPAPDGSREPLRANLFERMQSANVELVPLFPYFGEGAIVPAGAIMRGGPEADFGQFFHWNTTDEVVIAFGAQGALTDTGMVFVGQNMHGVNSFLKNPQDPGSFLVTSITQRQRVGETQQEAIIFRCLECKEVLMRFDFDATPAPADHPASAPDSCQLFPTIIYSAQAAQKFNQSEAARTCAKCGSVNPPFPLERWGWTHYAEQSRTAIDALHALKRRAPGANDQE